MSQADAIDTDRVRFLSPQGVAMERRTVTFESGKWHGQRAHGADGSAVHAIGWALVAGITVASCASGRPCPVPATAVGAEGASPAGKLAPGLEAFGGGVDERPIAVLIRTQGPISERERRALRAIGVEVVAVIGDVVSARVAHGDLDRLAALAFVRYVEPARALRPEPERRP